MLFCGTLLAPVSTISSVSRLPELHLCPLKRWSVQQPQHMVSQQLTKAAGQAGGLQAAAPAAFITFRQVTEPAPSTLTTCRLLLLPPGVTFLTRVKTTGQSGGSGVGGVPDCMRLEHEREREREQVLQESPTRSQ